MPIIFASSLLIFPSFVFNSLARATAGLRSDTWTSGSAFASFFQEAGRRLPAAELHLHGLLHHPDLLLLLLLDGDHVQPQGHGREPQGLRQLHPGLSARAGGRPTISRRSCCGSPTSARRSWPWWRSFRRWSRPSLNVDFTVASFLGGTGLLIVISVCLDLVQKIDSHLVMRNYPGLVNRK